MTPTQPLGMLHRHIAAGLTSRNETLACVEIGSGGQVSSFLTSEPGSSGFFAGALILTADASVWPQSIMGRCGGRQDLLESPDRMCGLAAIAQSEFGADWGLAVVRRPAAARHPVHFALRSPSGNATLETELLSDEVLQSGGEQLVQSVLQHVAERLKNYREDPP